MSRPAPPVEAVDAGRVRAVARRNVGPGCARTQPPEDTIQHPSIINARHPANLRRQQRLDHRPLEIRQIKTSHHKPPCWRSVNQSARKKGIPFMGTSPRGRTLAASPEMDAADALPFVLETIFGCGWIMGVVLAIGGDVPAPFHEERCEIVGEDLKAAMRSRHAPYAHDV